jgi:hypothetical protein
MSWASRHNLLARAVNRNLGGVSVTWGAVSGDAILERNAQFVSDGNVISVEYMLHNLPTAGFGFLKYDDQLLVDGKIHSVRECMVIGDGEYMMVALSKAEDNADATLVLNGDWL